MSSATVAASRRRIWLRLAPGEARPVSLVHGVGHQLGALVRRKLRHAVQEHLAHAQQRGLEAGGVSAGVGVRQPQPHLAGHTPAGKVHPAPVGAGLRVERAHAQVTLADSRRSAALGDALCRARAARRARRLHTVAWHRLLGRCSVEVPGGRRPRARGVICRAAESVASACVGRVRKGVEAASVQQLPQHCKGALHGAESRGVAALVGMGRQHGLEVRLLDGCPLRLQAVAPRQRARRQSDCCQALAHCAAAAAITIAAATAPCGPPLPASHVGEPDATRW
mmetsp:Transcript_1994/g.4971  ORF Transcript_1994/g.4971 Transcript_1994/m.4971 type:complete len:281 (-) Transcript_1994:132-974(-)